MRCPLRYVLIVCVVIETDIILNGKDIITPSEDGIEGSLCFYDVLADYFVGAPENGNPILDLIVQLWSQSFASHIFSLLFHKWVCSYFTFCILIEVFLPAMWC